MTSLPDPQAKARAIATIIQARAGTIADVAGRVSTRHVGDLHPEEWVVITDSIKKLIDELGAEYEDFAAQARFLV